MTAQAPTISASLAVLLIISGCSAPGEAPPPNDEPKVEAKANLPVAPAPRAKEDELPPPPAEAVVRSTKPWPELIIGRWREVRHNNRHVESIIEFKNDGTATEWSGNRREPVVRVRTATYRLDGHLISPGPRIEDDGIDLTEATSYIETLTEGEMVYLTVVRTRTSPEHAKLLAAARNVPVEAILNDPNDVREERYRHYYVRLKDK